MNRAALSFDWTLARAFWVTAETGSFSAAARWLGATQPTVGRQVAALEQALDMVLFERVGRRLALTPAGRDLLEQLRPMGEAAAQASLVAAGRGQSTAGEVCVSVSDIVALYVMPAIVAELRRVAPQIRLTLLATNRLSDLQHREADIALRHVAPTQSELIARKARQAWGRLYASPDLLRQHAPIALPDDLAGVPFIGIGDAADLVRHMRAWGLPVTLRDLVVKADSGPAGWQMAQLGLGIMPMSDDVAARFPAMQVVLPDLPPIPVPYWVTCHRELKSSPRLRIVFDHIAAALARPDV